MEHNDKNVSSVSVLMPVFNAQRYVAQAVESILNQTFSDFEFIIIDDGSTDESLKILQRYAAQDRRIRLVDRPNKGITPTLNEGIALSQGEFIARMDADDVAFERRLEVQYDFMHANPCVLCCGSFYQLIDRRGRAISVVENPLANDDIQKECLSGRNCICHPAAMFRRAAVTEVGGYDEYFEAAQDLDLWLRLGEHGALANVPEVLVKYRLNPLSITSTKRLFQWQMAREACSRAWVRRGIRCTFELPKPNIEVDLSRLENNLKFGWWAFNGGERRTAITYGVKSILSSPFDQRAFRLLIWSILKKPRRAPCL